LVTKRDVAKDAKKVLYLEQRQSRRRTTLRTGKILFNNGHCVVECTALRRRVRSIESHPNEFRDDIAAGVDE
jgi:hypothetical protein